MARVSAGPGPLVRSDRRAVDGGPDHRDAGHGRLVATREIVDRGTAEESSNTLTGERQYVVSSATAPGRSYEGRFTRSGELRVLEPVVTAEPLWHLFDQE